jgi:transcription initiation factor IIE alpha subunit
MSNFEYIKHVIEKILNHPIFLGYHRIYVELTGDVKAAIFLNQCVYWSDKGGRKDGYFFKSDKEMAQELGLSIGVIRRIKRTLLERGFIQMKLKKAYGAPTSHYSVDIPFIEQTINQYYENHPMETLESTHSDLLKSDKSLTEITTEIISQQNTTVSDSDEDSSVSYSGEESLITEETLKEQHKSLIELDSEEEISSLGKAILEISGELSLTLEEKERIKRIEENVWGEGDPWSTDVYEREYIKDKLEFFRNIYRKEGRKVKTSAILNAIEKPENRETWRKRFLHKP